MKASSLKAVRCQAQTRAIWKQQTSATHRLVKGVERQDGRQYHLESMQNAWPSDLQYGGSRSNASNVEICLAKRGQASQSEGRSRPASIKTLSCTLVSTSPISHPSSTSSSRQSGRPTYKKNKQTPQPWRKDITEWDVILTLTSTSLSIRWIRP